MLSVPITLVLSENDGARYDYWYSTKVHTRTPPDDIPSTIEYIEGRLSVPPLFSGDFCDTRVLGTRGDNTFGDIENLYGALEGPRQSLDNPARMGYTFHVSWSNSKTNCLLVRPSSYSC